MNTPTHEPNQRSTRGAVHLAVPRGLLLCLIDVPLFLAADPGSLGSDALGQLSVWGEVLLGSALDAARTLLDPESYRALAGVPADLP